MGRKIMNFGMSMENSTNKLSVLIFIFLMIHFTVANAALDSDGDGMSDEWEVFYSFDPFDSTDANGDADLDGKLNLEEFLADSQPKRTNVASFVESAAVISSGDAADDAAIWIHPVDKRLSRVIGTDKKSGVYVYDLDGNVVQYRADGRINNIDLRYGFPFNGADVDIAIGSNRTNDSFVVYLVDAGTGELSNITVGNGISTLMSDVYGFCMYKSSASGKLYAFINSINGEVEQWEIFDNGANKVRGLLVRGFSVGSQTEGCVADDENATFYIGEEAVGIWKYGAEPSTGTERVLVDAVGSNGHLTKEVEGLAIYHDGNSAGYLIASSQWSNDYVIYERQGDNKYVGRFRVGEGHGVDATSNTDGLEVINVPLNNIFPKGMFVAQDDSNPGGNQNFKFVSWESIANSFETPLAQNIVWEPRKAGLPVLATIGDQLSIVDQPLVIDVNASGVGGITPALTADLTLLPIGDASFIDHGNGSGRFSWIPFVGDVGSYSVTVNAIDGLDNSLVDSEVITITVNAAPTGELVITQSQVSGASDDAEEDMSGVVQLSSSDLELVQDSNKNQIVGMRFNNLQIPQGVSIINAYLEFSVDEVNTGSVDLMIAAEVVNNAPTFAVNNSNISSRTKTAARVIWNNEVDWTDVGALQRSPDISGLVQEVVNLSGWIEGNSMAILITGSSSGKRVADSFDGSPLGAPKLIVEYRSETESPEPPPVVETPMISPAGGIYTDSVTVSMSSATTDAVLYYTLDGTTPSESDSLYTVPFDLMSSASLTVKGFLDGYTPSIKVTKDFSISYSSVNTAPVLAAIGDRHANENQRITIDASASDTDGTMPVLSADLSALPTGDASFVDNGDGSGQFSWTPLIGDVGSYAVTISAIDGLDNALIDSEMVVISVNAPSTGDVIVAQYQISRGRDDAEEGENGIVDLSSSDLELVDDGGGQVVGLRFSDFQIPQGVTITNAYLEFQVDEVNSGNLELMIAAHATPNAPAFVSSNNNIRDRVTTTSNVLWNNEADWSVVGEFQQSPDISTVIQEVVNQEDWINGNAMAIIISGSSNSKRVADSYEGSPSGATKLIVEYRLTPFPTMGFIMTKSQVNDGSSDAEENSTGVVTLDSSDLEFVQDGVDNQVVGMRFGNLQIPQGAVITSAHLEFQVDELDAGAIDLMITAQASPNVDAFTSVSRNLSDRLTTGTSVSWNNEADWLRVGGTQQSPDISPLIQEVVNQSLWENGNATAIFITGSSGGKRVADSFEGNAEGAPILSVEYRLDPLIPNELITRSSQINNSSDDAEESPVGIVRLNSSDLELVLDGENSQTVGMRFNHVRVPQGAVISSAYLEFHVDEVNTGSIDLIIAAQASANAPTFTTSSGNISSRIKTNESVNWNSEVDWLDVGSLQQSPDISLVVQEVVNQWSWTSGNALVVIITGSSSGKRVAESFDGSELDAPRLVIEYHFK